MLYWDMGPVTIAAGSSVSIAKLPELPDGTILHQISISCVGDANVGFKAYLYVPTKFFYALPMAEGKNSQLLGPIYIPPKVDASGIYLMVKSTKVSDAWYAHMAYEEVKKKLI